MDMISFNCSRLFNGYEKIVSPMFQRAPGKMYLLIQEFVS
ncbi:hypothetical protein CEB3_c07710 [Peptococcaceae bacterium CEB3]|nr:hypothetical protein CEB3_c07710 [Peptococcaceae bacterium CEB3]